MIAINFSSPREAVRFNQALFEGLLAGNPRAADAVNDFTRMRMREQGFYQRIMPAVPISNDDLPLDVSRPTLFRTRSANPIRGISADCIVLDEVADQPYDLPSGP